VRDTFWCFTCVAVQCILQHTSTHTATHCNSRDERDDSSKTLYGSSLVLQCVAVCCSVLQCVAVYRKIDISFFAVYCSVLQCVAVCCSVLHCVAVCCSVSRDRLFTL